MTNERPLTRDDLVRELRGLGIDLDDGRSLRDWHASMQFVRWLRRVVLVSGIPLAAYFLWHAAVAWIKSVAKGQTP